MLIKKRVTTIPIEGVELKLMGFETVGVLAGKAEDKDIVWTVWKHAAVHKRTEKALRTFLNKPRAMASYGICLGVIGAIKTQVTTLIEVLPSEVKQIVGKKDASKKEVIAWVQSKHPEAPLSTYKGNINLTKAEHQADAVCAIHAAIKTDSFKHLLTIAKGFNHAN